jgi:hypothetical protein
MSAFFFGMSGLFGRWTEHHYHHYFLRKREKTMLYNLLTKHILLVASFAMILLILPKLTLAAELLKETLSSAEAQVQGLAQVAAGSASDTLKLCLERIPQDASDGQLMLAEQTCQQVEAGRTINQASLTF